MIEIVVDSERNLKNLKQIGSPQDANKIYVEHLAYARMQGASHRDKSVFVLMGHTERMEGKYATFVEAVIPVEDIEIVAGVPRWNNQIWSKVFREIKRMYEDKIIVGWALDQKGMATKMSLELERVHREHFGGVHQMVLLMDSLEREETFYTYKENRLVAKEGFYIYYHSSSGKVKEEAQEKDIVDINLEIPIEKLYKEKEETLSEIVLESSGNGRYREFLKAGEASRTVSDGANLGVVVAAAILVFVIGVGVYENRDSIMGKESSPTIESAVETSSKDVQVDATEIKDTQTSSVDDDYIVPIEIISGDTEKNDE